jgi:hypothetical protein
MIVAIGWQHISVIGTALSAAVLLDVDVSRHRFEELTSRPRHRTLLIEGDNDMRETMIAALESEIEVLMESWKLSMARATNTIAQYSGRQVSTHLGHNLGACAAELSELAGKIESTQQILAFVRQQV